MATKEDLINLITAQGDAIRTIKLETPGDKDAISAAVVILKKLKDEFKALTGEEFGAPAEKPATKQAAPSQTQPQGPSKKDLRKAQRAVELEQQKAERMAELEKQRLEEELNDCAKDSYGFDKVVYTPSEMTVVYTKISDITPEMAGKPISIRARLHNTRSAGSQCFMVLRERFNTLQTILSVNESSVSKPMLRYVSSIPVESIVRIEGMLVASPFAIQSCSITDLELVVNKFYVVSRASPQLPFSIANASAPIRDDIYDENETAESITSTNNNPTHSSVNIDTRLDNRIIDLRTPANQAILSIKSKIDSYFRGYMLSQGFREIHTPKLLGAASEGGANVFKATYFNTHAYLAQSPQLYKQMAICSDMERVFEVGPVFRAENSNTHRHLTEFTGYDFEMEIKNHYHEVLDVVDGLFLSVFQKIRDECRHELTVYSQQYPFQEFKFLENTLRFTYAQGVALLNAAGIEMSPLDDISTTNEKILGKIIKQKYNTDFYFLDKFPLNIRPFYTMPDPENNDLSNSFDVFMRGEEICSGSNRIHDPTMLEERARSLGVVIETIQSYIDSFKYGAPPHGGAGIGAERVAMLYLGCSNIRRISMFPRDPKRLFP